MAHDVFISHSSRDKAIADAVCARLEARGIRCWIAPRDVQPGLPYGEAIIDAIRNCRIMVLLLSSSANNSIHIAKEVERAVSHGATVIPLRIEEVMPAKSLDYFIGSVHWLDALTPPLELHLDSLADTICKILQPTRPPIIVGEIQTKTPDVMPAPATATTHTATASAAPRKNAWLVPALVAAGILVVVIVGVMKWSVVGSSSGGSTDVNGSSATPMTPARSALASPESKSPDRSGGKAATTDSISSGSDPLTGCWRWFNNSSVIISPNGLMTAGPFTAQWRLLDRSRRVYTFTWPEAVDSSTLSPDGRTLSGGNQYGYSMSATRLAGGPGLPGTWRWYNGVVVTIQPNGSFLAGNINGHWRGAGLSYSLTWPKPVDTVILSADQNRVEGKNQFGVHISGTKSGNCGGG